jgi:2-oxoglutarate dehydrogenase E2 component (dihydrolipoamide succinyltransferase)
MAAVDVVVPQSGESIREVQIGAWRKAEGDPVSQDEVLVQIETDKAAMDLPSPVSGVLRTILKKQGEEATVGDVIARIEEGAPPRAVATDTGSVEAEAVGGQRPAESPRVMPAARRAAAQQNIPAEDVRGTGPGGRVLKEDVDRHARAQAAAPPPAPVEVPAPAPSPLVQEPETRTDDRLEEIVPMSPMRRVIAKNLVEAQQTAALLTTFNEVDMSAVMAMRQRYQDAFQAKYGVKLGFMSFFVKAAVEALKGIPQVNAEIRGNSIVYKRYYDIGVAIGGGRGLVVPVLRNAERLSFAGVEKAIADFARRAKENQLTLSELKGGTFTISNGGIYGSMLSTPIVNPPQSGILGLHAIQDRPTAVAGQVLVRPMMYVALTYDHRIVDGREAVTFLKHIKELIEDPARVLIEI